MLTQCIGVYIFSIFSQTMWTTKSRKYIYFFLRNENLLPIPSHYMGLQVSYFSQDFGALHSNPSLLINILKLSCFYQETKSCHKFSLYRLIYFIIFLLVWVFFSLTSYSMERHITILFPGDDNLSLVKFHWNTLLF